MNHEKQRLADIRRRIHALQLERQSQNHTISDLLSLHCLSTSSDEADEFIRDHLIQQQHTNHSHNLLHRYV